MYAPNTVQFVKENWKNTGYFHKAEFTSIYLNFDSKLLIPFKV